MPDPVWRHEWWGEPWPSADTPASVCDDPATRVPVPVGSACILCQEPIGEGDRGTFTMAVLAVDDVTRQPVHIECQTRAVVGGIAHLQEKCICKGGGCDPDGGLTYRQSARVVWDWLEEQRTMR